MNTSLYKEIHVERGLNYHYFYSPASSGAPTLLFLHGFPSTSRDWRHQVDFFHPKGYGIVAPDMIGAGRTSRPLDSRAYRLNLLADDIINIIDAENVDKVVGVAHDWGCVVLSRLSALQPERFNAFVWLGLSFMEPITEPFNLNATLLHMKEYLGYEGYSYWQFLEREDASEVIEKNVDSFLQLFYPKDPGYWLTYMALPGKTDEWMASGMQPGFADYLTKEDLEALRQNILVGGIRSSLNWYISQLRNNDLEDNRAIQKETWKIQSPSFFAVALRDCICTAKRGKDTMALYAAAEVKTVEFNTGHWVHLEAVQVVIFGLMDNPLTLDVLCMYATLLNVCVALVVAWVVLLAIPFRRTFVERLPIPLGAEWIWGHERTVFMNEPGYAFRLWIADVGLTFRIKAAFGAPDVLVLCDPKGISHILQKKIYDYHHSEVVRPRVARLLGKGLGWVEGESEHKKMRRLVSPSLSAENIKAMSHAVTEAASRVINDLAYAVQSGESDNSLINILDWTSKATLNVIGRVAFLHDFDGGNSKDAQQILNARRKGVSPIAQYAGFLTLMLLRRFPILNHLPISAIQAQGIAKVTIQSGVANEMIKRNKDLISDGNIQHQKDLLTRLLHAEANGLISKEELYEQISTLCWVSGHETTTQTLGFTLWELARHPDCQHRLREEVEAFPGEPTYDDYQSRLPYLDAVLRETLRLYPGLPYMERISTKPDAIPLSHPVTLADGKAIGEVEVRAGQTVLIPIMAIHRLHSIWEDGDAFRPERWLEELPHREQLCMGWSNLLAFSDGPRSCIGMRLAIFQYKVNAHSISSFHSFGTDGRYRVTQVILTSLITRFRFEDSGCDISLRVSSSLQPWVVGEKDKGSQLPVIVRLA
ncbi:hypothetical protein EW146_g9715 [Bondarzewia mesenterica]|uniref:AB hydrolase-1 domain-containing protein n=1 Tax=Bondarzewia mesenterica TaxID=1095465 RepID=A0A4S4L924_9AGAM|nr:hypothetical protein EW146_g9715 [Bondarzewia mesenterica]